MLPDVMFSAVSNCFIKTHSPGTGEEHKPASKVIHNLG